VCRRRGDVSRRRPERAGGVQFNASPFTAE
jgi:hypothetical protein